MAKPYTFKYFYGVVLEQLKKIKTKTKTMNKHKDTNKGEINFSEIDHKNIVHQIKESNKIIELIKKEKGLGKDSDLQKLIDSNKKAIEKNEDKKILDAFLHTQTTLKEMHTATGHKQLPLHNSPLFAVIEKNEKILDEIK